MDAASVNVQATDHGNNGVRTTEIYLKATDTRDTANDSERRSARTPIRVLKELISMHFGE